MEPLDARRTWRTLEPVHAMVYFAPEADECYKALGLRGNRMGYFASRSAALGAPAAEVVIATFFNFSPALVRRAIPDAWAIAEPSRVLDARLEAADRALCRALGDELLSSDGLTEAAELARRAALAATEAPEGRPLFAAHAALDWPDPPHLVLWHAQTLLREFRGDAHVAALLVEGLSGIEALVVHAATGEASPDVLRVSRAWSEEEWAEAAEALRSRGLLEPGPELALSEAGRQHRQWVEDRTDAGALPAYLDLGSDGCERLRRAGRPLSQAVLDAGLIKFDLARFAEDL